MPYEKSDKVRVDLTEQQRRQAEDTKDDVEFHAEELEERIAPAQAPILPDAVV
jgi:hypothetical protein